MAVQRLRVADWRIQIQLESSGHISRSDFQMPRPESRGGCDCNACRKMAERIHEKGY